MRPGLTVLFLSKLENGHKLPTLSTMIRLAKALDLSIGRLVSEFEEELERD